MEATMRAEKVLLDKYDVQAMLGINERTMGTYLRAGVFRHACIPTQGVLGRTF
jgi:hypothetical protein